MSLRLPDWFVAAVVEPAWDLYEKSPRLRTLRSLQRSQWQTRGELDELQRRRLVAIVRHAAARSTFYERRFREAGIDPAGVNAVGDLAALPLLTKAEIRAFTDEIIADGYRRDTMVPAKTGGSTGVALQIYCEWPSVERRNAAALRSDMWSGWRLGQPIAAVWGNPPVAQTWRNRLRNACKDRFIYLDTMRIDERAIAQFTRDWQALGPGMLYGHAHSVFVLASALEGRDHGLRPRGIVTSSMMLLEPERRLIERVFGVPVTNRYGCEEVGLIACQCEKHGPFHLNQESCLVEFLRDDGTPCAPGEDGRIVVTDLLNRGMPLIRYEVGDHGVPAEGTCACGRGLALMATITGRVADFLRATDGSRVAGISLIENTLTKLPGIAQMQIVQNELDAVRINLVPAQGFGEDVERELAATLRGALGAAMKVEVVQVARIPQEPSGKYRFSICRVGAAR